MKRLLVVALMLFAMPLLAQNTGTQTSQDPSHRDAGTQCNSIDAASGSATLATPQSGTSWYVTWIDVNVGATGTVTAAAPVKATTAGLQGSPTFGLFRSDGMTIGMVGAPVFGSFSPPLKGLVNTAVSITGGAVANLVWHGTICGYQAP